MGKDVTVYKRDPATGLGTSLEGLMPRRPHVTGPDQTPDPTVRKAQILRAFGSAWTALVTTIRLCWDLFKQ